MISHRRPSAMGASDMPLVTAARTVADPLHGKPIDKNVDERGVFLVAEVCPRTAL